MFGIPFVFAQAGFAIALAELILIAVIMSVVHLAYGEVTLYSTSLHRLPGYVQHYFGRRMAGIASLSHFIGLAGSLLAYIVLGGFFLNVLAQWLLPGLPDFVGVVLFYGFGIFVIFHDIRFESFANALLTLGLVASIIILGASLLPHVSLANLSGFSPAALFVPYGVFLFAMAGGAVIPDVRRLLGPNEYRRFRTSIIIGTAGAAVLYILFAVAVLGVSGEGTTADAIQGIAKRFGPAYLLAGALIGFLATITSFIPLGLTLKGMLTADFRIAERAAWFLTAAIPGVFYLLGFRDFIGIVSAVGAIGIGLDSIFILMVHHVASRNHSGPWRIAISSSVRTLLIGLFLLGMFIELIRLL